MIEQQINLDPALRVWALFPFIAVTVQSWIRGRGMWTFSH